MRLAGAFLGAALVLCAEQTASANIIYNFSGLTAIGADSLTINASLTITDQAYANGQVALEYSCRFTSGCVSISQGIIKNTGVVSFALPIGADFPVSPIEGDIFIDLTFGDTVSGYIGVFNSSLTVSISGSDLWETAYFYADGCWSCEGLSGQWTQTDQQVRTASLMIFDVPEPFIVPPYLLVMLGVYIMGVAYARLR